MRNNQLSEDPSTILAHKGTVPIGDTGSRTLSYCEPLRPDTESKQAQGEFLPFALGVRRSNEAILITLRDGVIAYVNPAFVRLDGSPKAEVMGPTPRILKSGARARAFLDRSWRTRAIYHAASV